MVGPGRHLASLRHWLPTSIFAKSDPLIQMAFKQNYDSTMPTKPPKVIGQRNTDVILTLEAMNNRMRKMQTLRSVTFQFA